MNFQYYVVEFLRSPHESVPRFVCIPCSWIRSEPTPDANRTIAITFPQEQFVATEGRILAGEPFHSDWLLHMVNVKSGCDDLNESRKCADEHCLAYAAQENVQSKGNAQFRKPEKAAKRSMSEDAYYLNQESKRPNVQVSNGFKSPQNSQKDNSNREKECDKIAREKNILERLSCVFKEMHEGFDNITDTFKNMNEIVVKIKTTLTETDEFLKSKKNWQYLESSAKKMSERCQKSYEFPDDSDPNFKWTLRHRTLQHGLKELLPGSKLYVRIAELKKLDTEAYDPRTAARMLMEEIFSDNALSVCSLAGGKGGLGRQTINEKCPPPLDEYSRLVLMMYLKEYAEERGWPEIDEKYIWNSLRKRLLELRQNY